MTRDNFHWFALHMLFMGTGFCMLAFEVVWLRQVGLLLGTDSAAVGVVTATFMGGMGIGYVLAGRVAGRLKRPILTFGLLNTAIGGVFLLILLQFSVAPEVLAAIYRMVSGIIPAFLVRALAAAIFLLPPTVLMGATFPVLCAAVGRGKHPLGYTVGTLYAANLAGATAGSLSAGMWFLERFGAAGSTELTAVLSLIVGGCAFLLSYRMQEQMGWVVASDLYSRSPIQAGVGDVLPIGKRPLGKDSISSGERGITTPDDEASQNASSFPGHQFSDSLLASLCGLCAMSFQVVWIRGLILFLGSTIYAFSIALAVFLVGLAIGSQGISFWLKRDPAQQSVRTMLAVAFTLMGSVMAVTLLGLSLWIKHDPTLSLMQSMDWSEMYSIFHHFVEYPHVGLRQGLRLALITMLPVTVCSGMIMPLVAHLAPPGRPVKWVGKIYGFNAAGAITGALLGQFVLLGSLGVRGSLLFVASIAVIAGIAMIASGSGWPRNRRIVASIIFVVFFLCTGLMTTIRPIDLFVQLLGGKLLHYREDPHATVAIMTQSIPDGKTPTAKPLLFINGLKVAAAYGDPDFADATLVHVGCQPRDVAVIGLGAGGTCERAAEWEGVQVDCIEIVGAVIDVQEFFRNARGRQGKPPNVTYVKEDGRHYLLRTNKKYDAILVDGSPGAYTGGYALITQEFFELVARRLKPGGVLGIWAGIPEQYKEEFIRTLLSVFEWVDVSWETYVAGLGESYRISRKPSAGNLFFRTDIGYRIPSGPILRDDYPKLIFKILKGREKILREEVFDTK